MRNNNAGSRSNIDDELTRIENLRAQGRITENEYEAMRKKILGL